MTRQHPWMRYVLLAAAAYNIAWALWIGLFPLSLFTMAGLPAPNYPELWQGIGLMTGVWGIAYALASLDPVQHWAVVAAGLAFKVLGPAAFAFAAMRGRTPWAFGSAVVVNDLIWWLPFGLILRAAWNTHMGRLRSLSPEVLSFALRSRTDSGFTIDEMSRLSPVLLVFLRHAGCTFCREALADIAGQRRAIEHSGTSIVLVHMGEKEFGREFFRKYGLDDLPQISDPGQTLYKAFGLPKGTFRMLFGPVVWARGFEAGILRGHGVGRLVGDGFQMPGIFLVFHGQVLRSFRHQSVSDRPDYVRFVREHITATAR